CSFGGRFYSLEDTWHPDLGEPFGVMHCVQCHCEPICGVWKNLAKPVLRQLQSEQMRISMTTSMGRREEVEGKIIKHRALFAEEENAGMGGIAMLTLSDSENNLHFILILQGLIRHKDKEPVLVPIRVQLMYRQHLLREIRANITSNDPDFAEVLTDLNSRELFWLSRGQLEMAVATEGQDPRQISGFITGRKSCDGKCYAVRNLNAHFVLGVQTLDKH
ncbi:hypothetical protein GOODEAATRI_005070, partial [Goodea atripinnis]